MVKLDVSSDSTSGSMIPCAVLTIPDPNVSFTYLSKLSNSEWKKDFPVGLRIISGDKTHEDIFTECAIAASNSQILK